MTTKKRALQQSRTKPVASKPAAKAHKAPKVGRTAAKGARSAGSATPHAKPAKVPRLTRRVQLLAMLRRKDGVSIAEIVEAFEILPATARAMISVFTREVGVRAVLADGRYRAG